MSHVPVEWTRVIDNLRRAQVAGGVMKDLAQPAHERDRATDDYVRAVDAVIADLGALSERMVLGHITLFLARKGWR